MSTSLYCKIGDEIVKHEKYSAITNSLRYLLKTAAGLSEHSRITVTDAFLKCFNYKQFRYKIRLKGSTYGT